MANQLVTLFGGGGFLGRYVAQALMREGARVRIVERNPKRAWFLKPQGGLGQSQFLAADVTRAASAARAVAGADAVINLVGILQGDFAAVHVAGARNVAEAAATAGAKALVHVSAIGGDPASPSAYGRSKGEGEAAVRAAFPQATIARPSIVFGPEDGFVNRFARMGQLLPLMPVIRATAKFQPVYVADVARAVAQAALDPRHHAGRTYELGGPEVLTMAELIGWIGETTGNRRTLVEIPDAIGEMMAKLGFLPGAPITEDQWRMLQRDNVVAPGAAGFEAFGFVPAPLAAVGPKWLVRYRRGGRFSLGQRAAG